MASTAGTQVAAARHGDAVTDPRSAAPLAGSVEQPVVLGRLLRYAAAITSLTAAAVHASAIGGHAFDWLHLVAFVAMTTFQAWWAYLILRSQAARVLLIGAVGHGAILALWITTRTVGIPDFLPGSHAVEAVGLKDAVATLLAAATLGAIDALSRHDLTRRLIRPSTAGATASAFVLGVVLTGALAVTAQGHVHDPGGASHPHTEPHDH